MIPRINHDSYSGSICLLGSLSSLGGVWARDYLLGSIILKLQTVTDKTGWSLLPLKEILCCVCGYICMVLMTARTQHIAIMDWLFGHGLSVTLNHKITLLSACVIMYAPPLIWVAILHADHIVHFSIMCMKSRRYSIHSTAKTDLMHWLSLHARKLYRDEQD